MSDTSSSQDPMEFLQKMWGSMGFSLPGMAVPTLDVTELDKRIADLKAVEGWLKMNLGMLQMTIQGLEMQRATLAAMAAFSQPAGGAEGGANPFANPGLWPWNYMQAGGEQSPGAAAEAAETNPPPAEPPAGAARKKSG